MKTHTEDPVAPERMKLILGSAEDGVKAVGVKSSQEPPDLIVAAVDQYVFDWQQGKLPKAKKIDAEDAPFALGTLWGQQLVRAFGWHWAMITFHEHSDSEAPGVIAPDRSLAVYPIHFVQGCLANRGVDVTIALAYNMLKAGKVKGLPPNKYQNLMEGVRRIVPRV